MNAVATRVTKAKSRPAPSAKLGVDWTDMLPIVSDRVTTLLRVVADRLEPTGTAESGYRLSMIAADIIMPLINSSDADHVAWKLYDVCALLDSARHTAHEEIDSESDALLSYCHEMIVALALVTGGKNSAPEVEDMQRLLKQPMPDLPAALPRPTVVEPFFVTAERAHLAHAALCEVISWNSVLEREIGGDDVAEIAPAIFRRVNKLGFFVMSCIDDEAESTESLAARFADEVNA